MMDGFDAMLEFVTSNYGPLVESSGMLSDLTADIDRSLVPGGFPPDESTWSAWVNACRKVKSRSE